MRSCSLANVTQEPANETPPTSTVKAPAAAAMRAEEPDPSSTPLPPVSSRAATSAAAAPPTPLNRATSCGIWVMATRRAAGTPSADPTATATRIGTTWSRSSARNTTTQASAAPAAPSRLALRAVFGDERPLRARMKHTAATR